MSKVCVILEVALLNHVLFNIWKLNSEVSSWRQYYVRGESEPSALHVTLSSNVWECHVSRGGRQLKPIEPTSHAINGTLST